MSKNQAPLAKEGSINVTVTGARGSGKSQLITSIIENLHPDNSYLIPNPEGETEYLIINYSPEENTSQPKNVGKKEEYSLSDKLTIMAVLSKIVSNNEGTPSCSTAQAKLLKLIESI